MAPSLKKLDYPLAHLFLNGLDIIGRQKVGRIKIPLFVEDAIDNTAMEMKMRIQRFTEPLNPHFHFHCCIIDGVFDKEGNFYPANFLSPDDIQSVQEQVRKRVVKLF